MTDQSGRRLLTVAVAGMLAALATTAVGRELELTLQRRQQVIVRHPGAASDVSWEVNREVEKIDPAHTAIVIIDMWDKHWCKTVTARTAALVAPMNETLAAARLLGITVVHAPSDVVGFYRDTPQRKAMQTIPQADMQQKVALNPPPAPYGGGGCCCGPNRPCTIGSAWPWTRQVEGLVIADGDLLADCNNGRELAGLCQQRGITHLIYMGVALNMCVLIRNSGVLAMTHNGQRCIIVRDLTDAVSGNGYDPDKRQADPAFTPEIGTARVVEYVEKYVAPTIDRQQLLSAAAKKTR
jgi:nicotinamidase-related amidase